MARPPDRLSYTRVINSRCQSFEFFFETDHPQMHGKHGRECQSRAQGEGKPTAGLIDRPATARSREDETRNGHWNAKQNIRWSSQVSLHRAHLKRDLTFDFRGFRLVL